MFTIDEIQKELEDGPEKDAIKFHYHFLNMFDEFVKLIIEQKVSQDPKENMYLLAKLVTTQLKFIETNCISSNHPCILRASFLTGLLRSMKESGVAVQFITQEQATKEIQKIYGKKEGELDN